MEEHQAIALLRSGDLTGLEVLVRRYYFQAVRAADLIVRDVPLAEDIVQSAFLHATQKIDQLSSASFGPWFLKIVVNASIKSAEKQKRLVSLEAQAEDDLSYLAGWLVDQHPPVEQLVESEELRREIWQALEQLTPRQRAAVVMKYYLEMSESELSSELQTPRSTVKWLLYAARQKLRYLLKLPDLLSHPFEATSAYEIPEDREKE